MKEDKYLKNSLGFSMVEVIVVVFIMALVGTAVYTFQNDIFLLNRIVSSNITSQEEARNGFKMMTSEIRSASPSSLGAYPIFEANSNSFIFYSDIDNDGLKERIRYFLEGDIFKKGTIKPLGSPLVYNLGNEIIKEVIHNVSNDSTAIFDYYDANYEGISAPLSQPVNIIAVRLIKITIIADGNTFTTQVSMRNLKDNL